MIKKQFDMPNEVRNNQIKKTHKRRIYRNYFKRPLDFSLALLALIGLSLVMILTALLVRIKLGSPVIFRQERPGLNEKIFTLYKFRTMSNEKDEGGKLLPDSERLTKFGRFLRSTSIDELPELFNILKGDMSFIGPRPLLVKYLPFYREAERQRHVVRPGLTGLSQINGRNSLGWDERLRYDTEYVENISLVFDMQILLKSVFVVLKRDGVLVSDIGPLKDLDIERGGETVADN